MLVPFDRVPESVDGRTQAYIALVGAGKVLPRAQKIHDEKGRLDQVGAVIFVGERNRLTGGAMQEMREKPVKALGAGQEIDDSVDALAHAGARQEAALSASKQRHDAEARAAAGHDFAVVVASDHIAALAYLRFLAVGGPASDDLVRLLR